MRGPERNAGLDVEVGWDAKRPSPLAVRPLKDDATEKTSVFAVTKEGR